MPFSYENQYLTIVVVGASGDLAKKKTYPSLFELYCQGYLPKQGSLSIVGYARSAYTDDTFREKMRVAIGERGDRSKIDEFLGCCRYQRGETYDDIEAWVQLKLRQQTVEDTVLANRLFYFAIPPEQFAPSARAITRAAQSSSGWNRFIVEKPFGKDSESSLNTSSTDYQSYGVNLTFKTPLFYNSSSKASIKKLDNLSRASSVELSEKQRQVELSAISSYQNYKSAIAKTKASESEKKSSLLALNGIKKESEFGIRTILDVLDAEVDFLNASSNLIQSQADEIFSVYQIKSILGSLSIKDINNDLDVKYDLKENKLDFNILDRRMFN